VKGSGFVSGEDIQQLSRSQEKEILESQLKTWAVLQKQIENAGRNAQGESMLALAQAMKIVAEGQAGAWRELHRDEPGFVADAY
jgi:hypothetical protein